MPQNLAERFASLWDQATISPDVAAFLQLNQTSSLTDKISVVLIDQKRNWELGKPILVEHYLQRFPELAASQEAVLELVVGEYEARTSAGTSVSVDELASRFPYLAPLIQNRLMEVPTSATECMADVDQTGAESTASLDGLYAGERIGRYRLVRLLGEGGFGRVWLAFDEDLNRPVAIKIPKSRCFRRDGDSEAYLAEARALATLDHPNIVPVHDVGRTPDGLVYIVSKYVEGQNLAAAFIESRPTWEEIARAIATIARALDHAHRRHLIHRDVKPGNILIDERSRQAYLADFGLAIREEDYLREIGIAGTPSFMSPEQARGEGHRLGCGSDIFSLGTVFYVLLTGQNPFHADHRDAVLQKVISLDPTPPQEVNPQIPSELQRICLRAMSKRASDRYAAAWEFADDLEHWLAQPETRANQDVSVVPKGLRSFEAEDAAFFPELLPGPRNREGLPESISFWKSRIEEADPDKTFTVGLLYGPSGCGKSSLVKAGVLPRVAADIITVCVEATPDQTEARLLRSLRKRIPELAEGAGLAESFAQLRRTSSQKVVVVLDQFEQWLHATPIDQDSELVSALRQCDGRKLQAICLVRDDFAMGAARFMGALDVPIVQGHNFATVDLFDVEHARQVLTKFGRVFRKITESPATHQDAFVAAVATGLARNHRVVPVHLALFAEMVKDRPWTLATLEEVGGTEGIGVNFLDETFTSRGANPKHRFHQQAARNVLRLLLPDAGTQIKGCMRAHAELQDVSGYATHPRQFEELLHILDAELRLITPTDPEGAGDESGRQSGMKYYQLTHDFLVAPLREWLTRKQKESRRGRAELRLEELAAHWNSRPESRHLPNLWEWMNIRLLTDAKRWSAPQRKMMRVAGRDHGLRWTTMLLVLAAALAAFNWYFTGRRVDDERKRTKLLVDALYVAPAEAVPFTTEKLKPLEMHAVPVLRERFASDEDAADRLRTAVALSEFGDVETEFLLAAIASAAPSECSNIVRSLARARDAAIQGLRARADEANARQQWELKARIAIVALHLQEPSIAQDMFRSRQDPIERTVLIDTIPKFHSSLGEWFEILQVEDADFRSGICLGSGGINPRDLSSIDRERWLQIVTDWYVADPDKGVHSAAKWALRQWEMPLSSPIVPRRPVEDGDWYVNSSGMTMLRVPGGEFERRVVSGEDTASRVRRSQSVAITRPFWLSDCEVTRGQFETFMADSQVAAAFKAQEWEGVKRTRSPSLEHPVQNVSWNDAVLFCNWLSRKENLSPCYEPDGEDWKLKLDADGYRLPFEAEWEAACRAGTTTVYSFGGDAAFLANYAVCMENRTEICGHKLPNHWGFFDMHGNVYEWCHDWFDDYAAADQVLDPTGPSTGESRVLRGGAFDYASSFAYSASRSKNHPSYRSYTIGFRLARQAVPRSTMAQEGSAEK